MISQESLTPLGLRGCQMYSILPSETDKMNFAYDIWITDTDNPNAKTQRNEVMIWINRLNVYMPKNSLLDYVSDGYNTYDYYKLKFPWGDYHAFILNNKPLSAVSYHKANADKLIDYLVEKGYLNTYWYISRIDLGNEVWNGRGGMHINNLSIKINDIEI